MAHMARMCSRSGGVGPEPGTAEVGLASGFVATGPEAGGLGASVGLGVGWELPSWGAAWSLVVLGWAQSQSLRDPTLNLGAREPCGVQ